MGCRKRYFKTRKEAKAIAKQLETKFGHKHRVYNCPYCKGFHFTTMTRQNYKNARKKSKNLLKGSDHETDGREFKEIL